jgi:alcohol dehydrogenase class IV
MAAGWTNEVIDCLTVEGLVPILYSNVTPNPRSDEVMAGAQIYESENCDVIVAVGGGSVIDCAKGIGIASSNKKDILTFEGIDQIPLPMPPIICIPTTGGTSADVSQFAIIKNLETKNKIAIISKAVVPDVALIDPETLITMDPYLAACTAIDALVHGIEAFVSNVSSPITDLHALEGIRLLSKNMVPSIQDPGNLDLRTAIMLGSLQTGLAFSNASLGAVHAMAHSLGGLLDLAHGECNSMVLRHVIDYNFEAAPEKFRRIAEAMRLDVRGLRQKDTKAAILAEIDRIKQQAGIATKLGDRGVRVSDIPELAQKAMKDACIVTNPREPRKRDIEVIYEEAI